MLLFLAVFSGGDSIFAETVAVYPVNEPSAPKIQAIPIGGQTHEVKTGETLWRIAKKYQISVPALKSANGLTADSIRVGQRLRIPTPGAEVVALVPVKPASGSPPVTPVLEIRKAIPMERPPRIALRQEIPKPLKERFMEAVKTLVAAGVHYDGNWTPPGESQSWAMDCSNTSRWLMRTVGGIQMARTASDQYYDLRLKQRAWPAPTDEKGNPDSEKLKTELQVGDLLFWENTYRPQRDPPVTHVMVYLGVDGQGRMLMAGSQEGAGMLEPRWNGPDVYVFRPDSDKGGYYRWYFMGWTAGRFSGYGRPLNESTSTGEVMRVSRN